MFFNQVDSKVGNYISLYLCYRLQLEFISLNPVD